MRIQSESTAEPRLRTRFVPETTFHHAAMEELDSVVRAESQEAAARLFENHPHFSIFPGDAVEVMECLPVPNH